MAGYSLGEADLLRRAMGKKIQAEMEQAARALRRRRGESGVQQGQAETIFELLAKFADYGFNKSHAAAYALVAYQTAYMKANYPVEFIAASMTLDMNNTDKLSEFRPRRSGSASRWCRPTSTAPASTFEVGDSTIIYALAALKGVGRPGGRTRSWQARGDGPSPRLRISPHASVRARSTSG